LSTPEVRQVRDLLTITRTPYLRVATEAMDVELRRG
jgi:hypothetical protein